MSSHDHDSAASAIAAGLDRLTQWSAQLEWQQVPKTIQQRAALVLCDNLAAMIAARDEPELIAFHDSIARSSGPTDATVFNARSQRLDRYSAALANGAASDWCELDEGYRRAVCHAGIYCLPALLAEAEAQATSIADLLRALVIGYETTARIARTFPFPDLTLHPHGSLAAVGAAASVAALRRLGAEDAAAAISSAATMVVPGPYNHAIKGALVRNIWPGVGAWSGMRAVDWAGIGITGTPHSLHDVYARAFDGIPQPEELTIDLGATWALADGYHKMYACCQYAHSAVEASLKLRDSMPTGSNAATIERIHVDTHWRGRTLDNPQPATTLAAKFSMQHILAATALHGHAGAAAFHASTLADSAVAGLRERVTIGAFDPELPPPNDRPARLTWSLSNGETATQEVLSARGGPDLPFAPAEIRDKVHGIVDDAYPAMATHLDRLLALDDQFLAQDWASAVRDMTEIPGA